MYMHRNVTDKFIGTVVSCDIISTGSWYGDLPDSVPKEVKLNRKDYYIEEIQHISIKETISVTYGIKWEHISKPVEGKIESLTTKEYSIDESKKQYLLELMGVDFPTILTYMMRMSVLFKCSSSTLRIRNLYMNFLLIIP